MSTNTPRLGEGTCQCAACGHYFTSTGTFDQHRTWAPGTHDNPSHKRACLDPASTGLVQRGNGAWGGPPMTSEQVAKLRAGATR